LDMDEKIIKSVQEKLDESKEVKIRGYTKADYEEVKILMMDLAEIYNTRFNEGIWKKAIEKRQYNREKLTIVAEYKKHVVGVCFVDFHWNDLGLFIGTIKHMMIKKDARGMGIGRKMTVHIMQLLMKMNVDKVRINIAEATKDLEKYFAIFGFKPIYFALERDAKNVKFPFSIKE